MILGHVYSPAGEAAREMGKGVGAAGGEGVGGAVGVGARVGGVMASRGGGIGFAVGGGAAEGGSRGAVAAEPGEGGEPPPAWALAWVRRGLRRGRVTAESLC